jgi:hypothetical protein
MGEAPLCGERADMEEESETNEGAPSADSWEYADGDGSGVSINACDRRGGPFDGSRIG